jgi:acyl carrier protein
MKARFRKLEIMMTKSEISAKVRTFLARFIRNRNLEENDDIFALGFVNSLFAMQLVLFVEKNFDIKVEREDLELSNFSTVEAITCFVERKLALAEA